MDRNWNNFEENGIISKMYDACDLTPQGNTSNCIVNTCYQDWDLTKTKTNNLTYNNDNSNEPDNKSNQSDTNTVDYQDNEPTDIMHNNLKHVIEALENLISPKKQHFQQLSKPISNDYDNKNSEGSLWNEIASDNDQNNKNKSYQGNDRTHEQDYKTKNDNDSNSNDYTCKVKSKSEQPVISKSLYCPPELEVDNEFRIEAGSNFDEYNKIEVTVNGIYVPKNITSFQDSGLCNVLMNNLSLCYYTTPTPIQKYTLPIIMHGRDMLASAQTGSGKTAAFLLPILHRLLSEPTGLIVDCNHCEPQVLILSPTRELAVQICEVANRLSRGTQIRNELLYGGTAVYYQKDKILRGVHIIVATPGRLIEFLNRDLITFSSIRFVVLDEADQMLDMGFLNSIERIFNDKTMVLPMKRSTILFSATYPDSIHQIVKLYLKPDYISVAVGEIGVACKDVIQTFIQVKKFNKKNNLVSVLKKIGDYQGTIIFVEQKRTADFIAAYLCELDFPATSIHGAREQPEREKALRDFKTKTVKILVATAVAARGLDILGVTIVINCDLPKTIEEYIHRIGRTGRLGNTGKAISFFDPENDRALVPYLVDTLRKANQEIPQFLLQFSGAHYENPRHWNLMPASTNDAMVQMIQSMKRKSSMMCGSNDSINEEEV